MECAVFPATPKRSLWASATLGLAVLSQTRNELKEYYNTGITTIIFVLAPADLIPPRGLVALCYSPIE